MQSPINAENKIRQLNIIHASLPFTLRVYRLSNFTNQSNLKSSKLFRSSANRNNPESVPQKITGGINICNLCGSLLNLTAHPCLKFYLQE